MPKSNLDWLGVVSLWFGALIMAIKAGDLPLISGAPSWLASNFWGYVPFVLVTLYLILSLIRMRQIPQKSARTNLVTNPPPHKAANSQPAILETPLSGHSDATLPAQVARDYLALKMSDHTVVQEVRFLRPFANKWLELNLSLFDLSSNGEAIRAQLYNFDDERGRSGSPIFAYFDEKWEDHLQHLKRGDALRFRGRITLRGYGAPEFRDAEPL